MKNEKFVTPPDVVTALRAYPGWVAAGLDPNDYISTGHNRKPFYGAFQPRLGVSYDVRGDRDLVIFAGAGRYYDRSLFINSALETIKDYFQTVVTLQTCESAPGTPNCIPGALPTDTDALRALASATSAGEVHLLNNHLRVPYSDEFNFGVRKRLGRINTSATVSYIRSHNIYQMVGGNRNLDGTVVTPGDDTVFVYHGDPFSAGIFGPGSAFGLAPLSPAHNSFFISNSDAKATYLALYLQADKPYTEDTGWGFSGTLTLSRTRTNDSRNRGQIGDPFYFDSPHIGDLGWGTPIGAEKWRFVGTGTVRVPVIDAKLSTVVTLSSGPTYGGVLCDVPASAPGGARRAALDLRHHRRPTAGTLSGQTTGGLLGLDRARPSRSSVGRQLLARRRADAALRPRALPAGPVYTSAATRTPGCQTPSAATTRRPR